MTKNVKVSNFLLRHSGVFVDASSVSDPFRNAETPSFHTDVYEKRGGYRALEKSLAMTPAEVRAIITDSGLVGRGGACFPTGSKWEMAGKATGKQKYIICNAEEGEPGTFKDRVLLEQNPHQVLEGMIIGAYAVGAETGYIYINGGFRKSIALLEEAIGAAEASGYLGTHIRGSSFSCHIKLFRSMGAYICGEETALINSIEGKRGVPRIKPPYPTVCGLLQKPTVVNNVETLANIPPIILNGSQWYRSLGVAGSYGTKLVSISGNVKKPGVYEVEFGKYTLRELIHGLAQGIIRDKKIKAFLPGGASTRFLTNRDLDIRMDYASLANAGSSLGTAGMIVLDEEQSIPEIVKHLFDFYRHESCGVCVPCRLGTNEVYEILCLITEPVTRKQLRELYNLYSPKDRCFLEQIRDVAATMKLLSRCGLGQSAADPLQSSITLFENEYLTLIEARQQEYASMNGRLIVAS